MRVGQTSGQINRVGGLFVPAIANVMRESQQTSGLQRKKHKRPNERPNAAKRTVPSLSAAQLDLLSASQARQILGVSARAFRRHVTNGKLTPHSKTPGGHWRFLRQDLEIFRAPAQASSVLEIKRERVAELNLSVQETKAQLALRELQDQERRRAEREEEESQAKEEQAISAQQEAEAAATRRERERAQVRAAARAAQAREDWKAEWIRDMLMTLPRDIPPELRLEIIEILQHRLSELYETSAGHAEDVVDAILRDVVERELAPWRHGKEVARAAAAALDELPLSAKSSAWGKFSDWERHAREEALAAIAALPDGATIDQMEDAARIAGRRAAQAYSHQERVAAVIADITWSLPRLLAFSNPQARAKAAQAMASAVGELAIGASDAEFNEVRDAALAPFAAADAQARREDEVQRANARHELEAQQAKARIEVEVKKHLERVFSFLSELDADPEGWDFEGKLAQYSRQIAEDITPDLIEDLPLDFFGGRRRVEELVQEWLASHS
jgi:hypothetical protein